jgi:hypothetical protein
MPGRVACASVAVALAVSATAGAVPGVWPRRITSVTAAALLARGVGGLAADFLQLGHPTERFRRWDMRLYSPLCLALGAGAALRALDR